MMRLTSIIRFIALKAGLIPSQHIKPAMLLSTHHEMTSASGAEKAGLRQRLAATGYSISSAALIHQTRLDISRSGDRRRQSDRGASRLPAHLQEADMSATKQQERLAKETSWLAQLRGNAQWAGFSLEHLAATASERYGKPLQQLTVTEAETLAWEYAELGREKRKIERAARTPINGRHSHPCFDCGSSVSCGKKDCRDTVSECRMCHEGIGGNIIELQKRKLAPVI